MKWAKADLWYWFDLGHIFEPVVPKPIELQIDSMRKRKREKKHHSSIYLDVWTAFIALFLFHA